MLLTVEITCSEQPSLEGCL